MNPQTQSSPWPPESEAVLRQALGFSGVWRRLLDTLPPRLAGHLGALRASFMPDKILDTAIARSAGFMAGGPESGPTDGARHLACRSYRAHSIADAEAWVAGRVSPIALCRKWQLADWEKLPSAAGDGGPGTVVAVPRLAGWGMACRALMLYRGGLLLCGPVVSRQLLREANYQLARGNDIAWLVEATANADGGSSLGEELVLLAATAEAPLRAIQALRLSPASYRIEVKEASSAKQLDEQIAAWVGEQVERWPWGLLPWAVS